MNNTTIIDLSGEWNLSDQTGEHALTGQVPGCVHLDLLSAECIPDPYYRDNENHVQWVSEREWLYSRTFEVSDDLLDRDQVLLRCEGLDTFAEIQINGQPAGRADNMFRTWEFDVRESLRPGENEIAVRFKSLYPYMEKQQAEQPFWQVNLNDLVPGGRNWIRKEQCNFGWDWGPALITCGIWRPICIVGIDTAKLGDVQVLQEHLSDGSVRLEGTVVAECLSATEELTISAVLKLNSVVVAEAQCPVADGVGCVEWTLEEPRLWWPNGMGEQPLYCLEITLLRGGEVLDQEAQTLGLRTFDLVREADEWGQSFAFRVNGIDFFAKGANWIPADTFDGRVSEADLRDLLQAAVEANMNCIRVWGGGLYERDIFYDLCDELGLLVWQDFMFACSAYPASDADFMENVRMEAVQNVKRLRSHASLALWCGNNELEQIPGCVGEQAGAMSWKDYSRLFDEMLADIVKELDPCRPYWPSSEHTPVGDRTKTNDPCSGDAHCWAVWHGGEPFEWYRTSLHRFCSEFGFQSFAHPVTVDSYTLPEDRNITSYVMEHHQKSGIGNAAIIRQMLNWFRLPVGFENTVWLSQILQGLAIKYAVEHWRQNMPRCMGALYWQLNDCWPVASWSSIDSNHRWKALHYDACRFFAPDMVSAVEDVEKGTIAIHVTSDIVESRKARVHLFVDTVDGELVRSENFDFHTPSNGSTVVSVCDLSGLLASHSKRILIITLELEIGGTCVSRNMATLIRPKHLELRKPQVTAEWVQPSSGDPEIVVRTDKPALWVWLDFSDYPDLRFSDNFFHLRGGEEKRISLRPIAGKLPDVSSLDSLTIRDLTSTY